MAQDDWFRKSTWTDTDAQSFFARLSRSRTAFHKAQYLRIQAYTLAQTRKEFLVRVALELLQQIFTQYPEPSELSSAHLLAAQCCEQLGEKHRALDHFQLSLDAQAQYPNRDPGTTLEYPWFVVTHGLADHYGAAIGALQKASLAFPVQLFKAAAVRAFVAQAQGDSRAAQYASEALEAAGLKQSPFRHHRDLGLVGEEYGPHIERLHAIAAA